MIDAIQSILGMKSIHDLHIWSITSGRNALSGHVVIEKGTKFEDCQNLLQNIENTLAKQKIGHVTIQLENVDHPHSNSIMCQHVKEIEEGERPTYAHQHYQH